MLYLKKLKIILPFSFILATVIYCSIYLNIEHKSKYNISDTEFVGNIERIIMTEEKVTIYLKAKEKLLINYYKETEEKMRLRYLDLMLLDVEEVLGMILKNIIQFLIKH